MAEDISAGRLSMDAESDVTGFGRRLQTKINAEVREVRAKIKAEIDQRGLKAKAQAAARVASEAAKIKMQVQIEQRGLIGQARAAALAAGAAAKVKMQAEVDTRMLAATLRAEIIRIQQEFKVHLQVTADTRRARAEISRFRQETARKKFLANFSVNTSGLEKGAAAVAGLSKLPLMAGGVFLLASALVQVGGGLIAIVSSASQAAVGLAALPNLIGVIGQAAAVLLSGFSGVGAAVASLGKANTKSAAQTAKATRSQGISAHQLIQMREAIGEAEYQLGQSQKAAKKAQDDLNKARQQARQDLIDLHRELKASAVDEEDAANGVAKAKLALQDAMWDKSRTEQERKDAALAVKDAEQQYKEAKDHHSDLAKQTKAADKAGIEGSDGVVAAKEAVADANHQVLLSQRAVRDATWALADAQKRSTAAAAAQAPALSAVADAMDNLSPAGQRFARFVYSVLMPRLKQLKFAIQEALLPQIQRAIVLAMPLLDVLQKGLVGTANVIGRFAVRLGALFGSKGFGADVGKIMQSNNRALDIFGDALMNLIRMFTDIAVVAGPHLLVPFAKFVRQLTETWREMAHTGRETGTMAERFDRARVAARRVWNILGNLLGAIHGIGKAATPAGDSLLRSFEKTTKRWTNWANSDKGQKRMHEFFAATKPATREFGKLVGHVTALLIAVGSNGGGPLVGFIKTLNWLLGVLTKLMDVPVAGDALGWVLTAAGGAGAVLLLVSAMIRLYGGLKKLAILSGLVKVFTLWREGVLLTAIQLRLLAIWEGAVTVATTAQTAALWLMRGAMTAVRVASTLMFGPWGLAILAVVGLFVLLYKKVGWFRAGVQAVMHGIVAAFKWVVDAAKWLWDVLFGHSVFPDIMAGIRLTGRVIAAVFNGIKSAIRVLGHVFTWLWNNAVKPAWNAIKLIVQTAWRYYYRPILMTMGAALKVLGRVFTWLWNNAVKPAWTAIRNAIRDGWNKVIHPAISAFAKFMPVLRRAFKTAVDAIRTMWNGLKSMAKGPVEFIVNTIYSKGLRPMINALPGVKDLPSVHAKFARGGVYGQGQKGAILPGYTPGRDVHRFVSPTGGMLDLSGGEGIMIPQFVRRLGSKAVGALNAAARKGGDYLQAAMYSMTGRGDLGMNRTNVPAFAGGGVLSQAQVTRGQNFARSQVGKPYSMGAAGPGAYDCSGFIAAIENVMRGDANPFHRLGSTATFPWAGWKPGVGQFTVGSTPNYGGSGIGHMAGTLAGLKVESYGGHGPSTSHRGYNDRGFSEVYHLGAGGASASGGFFALIKKILGFAKSIPGWLGKIGRKDWGPMIRSVIGSAGRGAMKFVNDKIPGPGPVPSIFDRGGSLHPGRSFAYNGTGKIETVFTNENMVDMTANLSRVARSVLSQSKPGAPSRSSALVENLSVTGRPDQVPAMLSDVEWQLRKIERGGVYADRTP